MLKPKHRLAFSVLLAVTAGPASAMDATPVCTQATRACDVLTVRAYFHRLLTGEAAAAPLAADLRVTEQGAVLATPRAGFLDLLKVPNPTVAFKNLRIVADGSTGQVAAFLLADVRPPGAAPYTVRRVQRMHIVHGLITEAELIIYRDDHPTILWPEH
jgi:hypothetical protein